MSHFDKFEMESVLLTLTFKNNANKKKRELQIKMLIYVVFVYTNNFIVCFFMTYLFRNADMTLY